MIVSKFVLLFFLVVDLRITSTRAYDIKDVLRPLRGLQITIHLPSYKISGYKEFQTTTQASVDYLAANLIPVKMFRKGASTFKSDNFKPGRHDRNTFACLVFIPVKENSRPIFKTHKVLISCSGIVEKSAALHKARFEDLVHVIFIHQTKPKLSSRHTLTISRCETPSYLLVFHVLPSHVVDSESIQALDVCYDKRTCRIISLPMYFTMTREGISTVINHLVKIKKNFAGDRVAIYPHVSFFGRWEAWRRILTIPLRKRQRTSQVMYAGFLEALPHMRNLTFDTVQDPWSCKTGVIQVSTNLVPEDEIWSYNPATVRTFGDFRAVTASELDLANPLQLCSLALPLSPSASWPLLSLALCVTLVFIVSMKTRDAAGALLLTFSSFCSQVSCRDGQLKVLQRFFIPWLLIVVTFASIYVNFLASIVVVPEKRILNLTVDRMVQENFTILAFGGLDYIRTRVANDYEEYFEFGKFVGNSAVGEFIRRERLLADHVKDGSYSSAEALWRDLLVQKKTGIVLNTFMRDSFVKFIKFVGRNADEGNEPLFTFVDFVSAELNEKPLMIRSSLEWMKASGHFYHFLHEAEAALTRESVAWFKHTLLHDGPGGVVKLLEMETNPIGAGFTDSLVAETFVIFIYCLTLSIVSLVLELGGPFVLRMARAVKSRTEGLLRRLRARAQRREIMPCRSRGGCYCQRRSFRSLQK